MYVKELMLALGMTVLSSTALVALGLTTQPPSQTEVVAMSVTHATSVAASAFEMQATGFCEPSIARNISVNLQTGETREAMC
ncbi:MAG: hypothetical protein AAFQ36_10235 [Pseudomonadota bacterium]